MKTGVALVLVGVGALCMWVILTAIPQNAEQCRLDAVNAMCEVYGNRSGGEKEVLAGDGGYYVVCENYGLEETWKNMTLKGLN